MEMLKAGLDAWLAAGKVLLGNREGLKELLEKEGGLMKELEGLRVALQDAAGLAGDDGRGEGQVSCGANA
jgi:hypothetical protein